MERLFFGYSSQPELLRETLHTAASKARGLPQVESSISWEDMRIDGRLIMNEIEDKIKQATTCVFDLTSLSDNVLFELGLAIGQQKIVVIFLDSDDRDAAKRWAKFPLLTTTGWTGYQDGDHLHSQVARLVSDVGRPLWEDLMHGTDANLDEFRLSYFPSAKPDKASQRLSRLIERQDKFDVDVINFDDYGTMPLEWFAEQLYRSRSCIFHMTPSRAYLADTVNPRLSLLAGIARGLERDVVFVTEENEPVAIDYRDLAIRYTTVPNLEKRVTAWLENLRDPRRSSSARRPRRDLTNELASLRFGNHVAEKDQEGLEQYFVETSDFHEILNASATIFTGKKGAGKTANMLRAAAELQRDARNLVCTVKPASYELEGLLEVLRKIDSRHLDDYLIEALWKYLLYTEIAKRAVEEAEARPAGVIVGTDVDALRECLNRKHHGVSASLSVRLEKLVDSLVALSPEGLDPASISASRDSINAALYGGTLKELRTLLGKTLVSRTRVAVLVDNLDKAWERGADLNLLARLLLGLLSVVGRVVDEFQKENPAKARVNITLTVFLRSDIYAYIRDRAREPDKIGVAEIEWRDANLLARVIEDRFLAGRSQGISADELWTNYFSPTIAGVSSRDYILSRVQDRPRDLVFLANAAVSHATNAKHRLVEEGDILEAEKVYSQFAYEALLVEGLALSRNLDNILIEFAGEPPVIEIGRLEDILAGSGLIQSGYSAIISTLRRLGFLGLETTESSYDYGGTDGEMRRADVLAKKHEKATGRRSRFQIHSAYRAYLGVTE